MRQKKGTLTYTFLVLSQLEFLKQWFWGIAKCFISLSINNCTVWNKTRHIDCKYADALWLQPLLSGRLISIFFRFYRILNFLRPIVGVIPPITTRPDSSSLYILLAYQWFVYRRDIFLSLVLLRMQITTPGEILPKWPLPPSPKIFRKWHRKKINRETPPFILAGSCFFFAIG